MGVQAPQAEETYDYNRFSFLASNRPVSRSHVNNIKTDMQQDPDHFQYEPIICNSSLFIFDGQHRFTAAKELHMPIWYVIREDATIEKTRRSNAAQRSWSLMDYAHSYATGSNQHYKDFLRINARYPEVPPSVILDALYESNRTNSAGYAFRNGEFSIADKDKALEQLDFMQKIVAITHTNVTKTVLQAIQSLWANENFNADRFLKNLPKAPQEYQVHNQIRHQIRSFEDVMNWHMPNPVRLN